MKPLLVAIDAKYIHKNTAVRLLKAQSSIDVDILDFTIKDDPDAVYDAVIAKNPLFVGFSTYIWNVETVMTLTRRIKRDTGIPVVLGGPETSHDARHFLETTGADLIVKGEGEAVFDDVIAHFSKGRDLRHLPSIAGRTKKGFFDNPIEEIQDLSALASPHRFIEDGPEMGKRIAYVESSRGCPYKCSYCLSSMEKKVRFFNLSQVKEDILHLLENGAKTFKFLDRTFNANPEALEIVRFITENHKEGTVFQFEMTGDTLDEEIVACIHENAPKGLFRFEIGIQSTNKETNRHIGRTQDNEKLFRIIRWIRENDVVDLHLDLIAGLPAESLERFKNTFDETFALGARELQLGFLKLLRGTRIRKEADRFAYVFEERPPYTVKKNHVLAEEDLETMKNVERMLDIFHNRGLFGDTLFPLLLRLPQKPFDTFLQIHKAFHEKGIKERGYQLHELYAFIDDFLAEQGVTEWDRDALKRTYLKRSRTKPKCYFAKITDKKRRGRLIRMASEKTDIPYEKLQKHSVLTTYKDGYLLAHYQDFQSRIVIL